MEQNLEYIYIPDFIYIIESFSVHQNVTWYSKSTILNFFNIKNKMRWVYYLVISLISSNNKCENICEGTLEHLLHNNILLQKDHRLIKTAIYLK